MLGWNKGVTGWARDYIKNNVVVDPSMTPAQSQNEIDLHTNRCIEWVKENRKMSSRKRAAPVCEFEITQAFRSAGAKSEYNSERLAEYLTNPIVLVAIAAIFLMIIIKFKK